MMVKTESHIVVNTDDTYYVSLKLRRESKKKEKELRQELLAIYTELAELKLLIKQSLTGYNNG
jgi:hypothetical protein